MTALLLWIYLVHGRAATATVPRPPVIMPVAAAEIPARTIIKPGMLLELQVPADKVPLGVVHDAALIVDHVTTDTVGARQPFWPGSIAAKGVALGLAYAVEPGLRAVTVPVTAVAAVGDQVQPGDHVDVIGTFKNGAVTITRTVLQNVVLLAVGSNLSPAPPPTQGPSPAPGVTNPAAGAPTPGITAPPQNFPHATLQVSPSQAQLLVLSLKEGDLSLDLRAPEDDRVVAVPAVSSTMLVSAANLTRSSSGGSTAKSGAARPHKFALPPGFSTTMKHLIRSFGLPTYGSPPFTGLPPAVPGTLQPVARTAIPPAPPEHSVDVIKGQNKETVDVGD